MLANLLTLTGTEAPMDGAYDKLFCRLHQPDFPLRLIPPYASFTVEQFERFVGLLRQNYPGWLANIMRLERIVQSSPATTPSNVMRWPRFPANGEQAPPGTVTGRKIC